VKTSILNRKARLFPCCVCHEPREVRTTKKGKPYMICDPCGMQMFVRVETGIRRFEAMIDAADLAHERAVGARALEPRETRHACDHGRLMVYKAREV